MKMYKIPGSVFANFILSLFFRKQSLLPFYKSLPLSRPVIIEAFISMYNGESNRDSGDIYVTGDHRGHEV